MMPGDDQRLWERITELPEPQKAPQTYPWPERKRKHYEFIDHDRAAGERRVTPVRFHSIRMCTVWGCEILWEPVDDGKDGPQAAK